MCLLHCQWVRQEFDAISVQQTEAKSSAVARPSVNDRKKQKNVPAIVAVYKHISLENRWKQEASG